MSCFVFVFFFCFSVHRLTHALCIATINQTDQCHCVYITLLLARQIQAIITMYYIELYMGKFRTNNQANITMSSTSLLYTLTFFSRKTMCSFLSQKTFCSNPTQKSTGEKKKNGPITKARYRNETTQRWFSGRPRHDGVSSSMPTPRPIGLLWHQGH